MKKTPERSPDKTTSAVENGLKYHALFEAATDAIFLETLDGRILDGNPAALKMFGYTLDELRRLTVRDLVPEEVARTLPDLITEELTTGGFFVEAANRRRNGELFPVEVSSRIVRIEGAPQVVVFVRDITERKKTQAALAEEKERLAVTLRSIGDGVIATDETGRVMLVNRVAESLTGWKQEEAVGRPLEEVFHLIHEKTRQRCENPVSRILASGGITTLPQPALLVSRDGHERHISDSGAPIRDRDSRIIGVVLAFRDVTEARRSEEERFRAQKLESLGLLAGGIAHDFNNILTGILGNISLARMALQAGQEHPDLLIEAEKACLRAKDLSQQLLTFSKGGAPVRQVTSISGLLRDTVDFCLRGANVRSELLVPEDLWPVEIDPAQIAQVLNNIVLNAKQAMASGGVVLVRAENMELPEQAMLPLNPGRYICITVRDTGHGIPPEYLAKVFDPFFTTRPNGSGLGLTTAFAIVRKHGGHISLESELGLGTSVSIYLAAGKGDAPEIRREQLRVVPGQGRVLVMDDEEMVRYVAERVLRYLGYEAVLVPDGEQAVREYRRALDERRRYDVVVLDLTVPGGMGGRQALESLRAMDPKICAVVSSGYSNDDVIANHRQFGFTGAVIKPFTVDELGRILQAALQEKRGR